MAAITRPGLRYGPTEKTESREIIISSGCELVGFWELL